MTPEYKSSIERRHSLLLAEYSASALYTCQLSGPVKCWWDSVCTVLSEISHGAKVRRSLPVLICAVSVVLQPKLQTGVECIFFLNHCLNYHWVLSLGYLLKALEIHTAFHSLLIIAKRHVSFSWQVQQPKLITRPLSQHWYYHVCGFWYSQRTKKSLSPVMESRTPASMPRPRTQGQGQGLDSQGQDQGLQNCPRGSLRTRTCRQRLQHWLSLESTYLGLVVVLIHKVAMYVNTSCRFIWLENM